MMRTFRLALAQINLSVGDLSGNTDKIIDYISMARDLQVDMIAFPELAIPGYPPEDLVLKPQFIEANLKSLKKVVEASQGISVVVGFVDMTGGDTHNAAAVAADGKLVGVYHKIFLPNYGVFDEDRYFKAGNTCPIFVINGTTVGVNICEDAWYALGPTAVQRSAGAEVIVNINGSPFYAGKRNYKEKMLATRAVDNSVFFAYVNLVGGQDELVFDGGSMVFNPQGDMIASSKQFENDLLVVDLEVETVLRSRLREPRARKEDQFVALDIGEPKHFNVSEYKSNPSRPAIDGLCIADPGGTQREVYDALVLGTRDYVLKVGFKKVLIALSGGIDSSLVAAIAVDALGAENVVCVAMPSRYSSEGSVTDAELLAENLGIELWNLPIEELFSAYLSTLAPKFEDTDWGIAEENIQSRIRGNLIMALSNKFGWMVLTTGNKSEMATGYATIYGDMSGGLAVIKDVPKILCYELAEYRNAIDGTVIIPQSVINKPPSAELRPDQLDEDSLPPYEVLDAILKAYVQDDFAFDEIVALGYEPEIVKRTIILVDRNEYKRRQAAPGIKITPRNFGRDRRMPIANRYRPF
jgi:NAD+ synthase (glutamine-hydrolysing)